MYKKIIAGLIGCISLSVHAQYTPLKGDVIRTEVESTFENLMEDASNPVPLILKVTSVRFMGYKSDYKFKSYECKTVAVASMPKMNGDFEVRTPRVLLRLDSLICHKSSKNKDKYVVTDNMKGWGLQNQVIGVMLNDNRGLTVGDKIDFFVNDKGVTTVYYRPISTEMDEEVTKQVNKITEK